jgi:hypothetical protein
VIHPWTRIAIDSWFLGLEATNVIALRTMKLAVGGPHAEAESRRMVEEKLKALVTLQWLFLTGGLGLTAPDIARRSLLHYRKAVRRNRHRLTRFPK